MPEIISRGAEAILYLSKEKVEGKTKGVLVKERIKKGYRIPQIDNRIRSQRTKREEELLSRVKRYGVNTPRVFRTGDYKIVMEFLGGKRLKDHLDRMPKWERLLTYKEIGLTVARMHNGGVMHGDLTTSNMILVPVKKQGLRALNNKNNSSDSNDPNVSMKLYLIDFGLGKTSKKVEDQAVDLFLLYEAIKATHFKLLDEAWGKILKAYKQEYSNSLQVLKRLEEIRNRRRYK